MTKQEWINQVHKHKDALLNLIESYHPASRVTKGHSALPITAPGAESACRVVREKIAAEEGNLAYPRDRFLNALAEDDWQEIDSLLNSAWFGVPESTSCWQIEGFSEAVDLIEDPPEETVIEGDTGEMTAF
jgi:hypothetical protein